MMEDKTLEHLMSMGFWAFVLLCIALFCNCAETVWIWKGMVTDGCSGAEWVAGQITGKHCTCMDSVYDSYEVECR